MSKSKTEWWIPVVGLVLLVLLTGVGIYVDRWRHTPMRQSDERLDALERRVDALEKR